MCSNDIKTLCFIHYKGIESSNVTQIDAMALVVHLASTLSLILDFKDEKNIKWKSHFQLR